jgi:drug/metabolite transporter (DMT)-like permease
MSDRVRFITWLFLILSLLFQVTAIILGKSAALHMGSLNFSAFMRNPWYLSSLVFLVLQAFVWQLVLREVRLFVAYLCTSSSYFLVLAASRFLFQERVTIWHVIGATVMVAGVYLVVREDLP